MTSTSMMTRRVFHNDLHSSFTFVLYRLDQNAYKTKVRQSVTVKWQRRPLQSPAASIPVRRCRPMPSVSLLLEFSWVYIHSPTYRSTFCSSVSGVQQHTSVLGCTVGTVGLSVNCNGQRATLWLLRVAALDRRLLLAD